MFKKRLTTCLTVLSALFLPGFAQDSETLDIRGVVVDTDDPPVPIVGATVFIQGSTTGTMTDEAGFFSINAKKGDIIIFSCIGYKDQEYRVVRSMANLSIALVEDVEVIDQAIVTGMTSQQRKHIASAVGAIDNSHFTNKPITQLSQALQGGTTGILVSQGSGSPGADNATIKIRGVASLLGSNPLVLVDGFEFDMNKLDPSTVESVSILKDAAAASIYGAKAGNGVILITTKRGTAGTVKVNYNMYVGVQTPMYMPEMASAAEYMGYVNEVNANAGVNPLYSQEEINMTVSGEDPISYPDTDWTNLILKKYSMIQEHNISVTGGNTTGRFALSAQYLKQDGIYNEQKNGFDRFTIRANTTVNLTKNIMIFVDTFLGKDTRRYPERNLIELVYNMPPTVVAKYPMKEGVNTEYYGLYHMSTVNAYALLQKGKKVTTVRDYVTINARPQWNIMPGLQLKGQVGYRLSTGMDKDDQDPYVFFNYFTGDEITSFPADKSVSYTTRSTYWSVGATLDWVQEFGKHRVNVLGGWNQEVNGRTGWDNIALVSFFAKAYYSWDDRYLFEAGARYDGSSLFDSKHKWGFFPSVAAGWNISNEPFMENADFINVLKLRVSYGMLGNNGIDPYSYQSLVDASTGAETRIGNPDLKWETVRIFDAGLDVSLFDYKVDFTVDIYDKTVDDLIMSLPATPSSGLLATPENVGKARVRGLELGLSYNHEFSEGVRLSISAGYSYNKSKWLDIPGGRFLDGSVISEVGGPLRAFYTYVADNLLTQEDIDNYVAIVGGYPDNGVLAQQPGDIKYVDTNGDGIITADDRVSVGDNEPHHIYYGNLSFAYKNFDIDMQVTGTGNYNGFLSGIYVQPLTTAGTGSVQKWQLDHWTKENPDKYAARPRPTPSGTANDYSSTFWQFNRAFARVKYIQVGYNFAGLAKKIHASMFRLYLNAQNPFTFSHIKIIDPETSSAATNYPMFKTYSIGLNIGF